MKQCNWRFSEKTGKKSRYFTCNCPAEFEYKDLLRCKSHLWPENIKWKKIENNCSHFSVLSV